MRGRLQEHIKLRGDADFNLRSIGELRTQGNERTTEAKTEDKVNGLISTAANAATQATATAMAAESASISALLTPRIQA